MFCEGHLMSHVLQWMPAHGTSCEEARQGAGAAHNPLGWLQFCALICSRRSPSSSKYSYTPVSGSDRVRLSGTECCPSFRPAVAVCLFPALLGVVPVCVERQGADTFSRRVGGAPREYEYSEYEYSEYD